MKLLKNAFVQGVSALVFAAQLGSAEAQDAPKIVEGTEAGGIVQYNLPTLRIKKSNGLETLTTGGTTRIGVLDGVVGQVSPSIIFDRSVVCLAPGASEPVACPPVPCSGIKNKPASSAGPACKR